MPTLILTPRFTEDSQALWRGAIEMGWGVERLSGWRVPKHLLSIDEPVLYLEALFGPTLAEAFGLRLVEPSIDWLPNLPEWYRRRRVTRSTLGEARRLTEPRFIKPPNDKSFAAAVYRGDDLPTEFDDATDVLIAEVVRWEKEFRCFALDREVRTLSIYLRDGELQRSNRFDASDEELAEAKAFAQRVLADPEVVFGRTAVLDVGVLCDGSGERHWAVVEQNAAWGSGIYGCDPRAVLEVMRYAAEPTTPLG